MNTAAIKAASGVIHRAVQQGRTLPVSYAIALDAAQLLQSPETATELEQWRATYGPDALPGALTRLERAESEVERLRARVAELEQQLAEDRPSDEDPIAYTLTEKADEVSAPALNWALLGRRIASARKTLGWQQDELAKRSDNSRNTISNYERGREARNGYIPRGLLRVERALGWAEGTARSFLVGQREQVVAEAGGPGA